VLIHHDGELADVRRLLDALGVDCVERLGAAEAHEPTATWDVIIATPRRILHFRPPQSASALTRIAVLDGDSRTLRAHLRRLRVEWLVRRPVHPEALRLLLLHVLYRGPERRRRRRVSVGADVRFRSGLLRRTATLTDLSTRGCRLLTRHAVARGKRISLALPGRITDGRPFGVKGRVVRSGPASSRDPGLAVMAVRFDESTPEQRRRLEDVVERFSSGPATCDGPPRRPAAAHAGPPRPPAPAEPGGATAAAETRADAAAPEPAPGSPGAPAGAAAGSETEPAARSCPDDQAATRTNAPAPGEPHDRRTEARRSFERRVVALGDEATRVLLGRDISTGGMRVDAHPGLAVGHRLRLALHAGARAEPIVVDAEVQRDDGDAGLVLRFAPLDDATRDALGSQLGHLPVLAGDGSEDDPPARILSEIIERETG